MTARVLVACEFSGVVRDAFIARGHDAVSCDLLPSETPGPHIQDNVLDLLGEPWDLVIAHPPCIRLCVPFWSNINRWDIDHLIEEVPMAINFFKRCLYANAPCVAVENPPMHPRAKMSIGSASCVVQPWHHGHPYMKKTLFWLRGLPPLMPTELVSGPHKPWVYQGKGRNKDSLVGESTQSKDRARTLPGIAAAMADQWGALL